MCFVYPTFFTEAFSRQYFTDEQPALCGLLLVRRNVGEMEVISIHITNHIQCECIGCSALVRTWAGALAWLSLWTTLRVNAIYLSPNI
jgi:hypothetical protein